MDQDCSADGCAEISDYQNQFVKVQEFGKKMCCSQHFVRNWHDSNGGGHGFKKDKLNDFNLKNFQCINWNIADPAYHDINDENKELFTCAGYTSQDACSPYFRQVGPSVALPIQEEIAKYDLLGVPQIGLISSTSSIDTLNCESHPETGLDPAGTIIPGLQEEASSCWL